MLTNFFKITLRNFFKNPVFSIINITGLSLGIMAFILILQYVAFEKSVNTFHANSNELHRVLFEDVNGTVYDYSAPIIGPTIKQNFAEVNAYCRIIAQSFVNGITSIKEGEEEKIFQQTNVAYTDDTFFSLFSFPVVAGNVAQLSEPNTTALSVSTAKKYFNETSPLGKTISFNNEFGNHLYKIVAVYEDFPPNSDLQFELIHSIQTLANPAVVANSQWASLEGTSSFLTTYLLTEKQTDISNLEIKMNELKKKLDPQGEEKVLLQPLRYMHLAASLNDKQEHTGNVGFVYLLSGIALVILVIAWFNYINLSTASALTRAKEIGIRKVVGASKAQLVFHFLGESFLLNTISLLLALGAVNIFQVFFNDLIGIQLSLTTVTQTSVLAAGTLIFLAGALASGAYTAFALSSFNPAQTLKGVFSKSTQGLALRKLLVVFQFSVSVLLIAATLVINKQLSFMRTENLGMNTNQLMVMTYSRMGVDSTFTKRHESFKNVLSQKSYIAAYSSSANVPGNGYNYSTSGITKQNPQAGDEKKGYSILYVDDQFFATYQISLASGSFFSQEICRNATGKITYLMLNESAANQLGFSSAEEAIGKTIKWNDAEAAVYGVVKDYHHQSLKEKIEPTIYVPQSAGSFFTVRLQTTDYQMVLHDLQNSFKEYFPGNPFDFFFVDEKFNQQYRSEEQNQRIFIAASCLAIFIACLGLFGLATFTVQQRTKEIGLRKVMGASLTQLTTLLSRDFIFLVLVAFAISTPLAAWATKQWLGQFAYQTELSIWVFALAGALVTLIAFLTISLQTLKVANANPVDSLRSE
ncbi:MAG: ABC transporter permease [Cyclobacteriaceae bacterium]|jgi:putative ABC transport system permease protein|nr:ABC transporter permease [Cyclobacteriaceae bacterium]